MVPTVNFRVLFVLLGFWPIIGAFQRHRPSHVGMDGTADWRGLTLPWDTAPRYLLRDRDSIYGDVFRQRVRGMAIREVLTAPRSPWQSPYVERRIGSIRRECLDHLIVLNEESLRQTLKLYFAYYLRAPHSLIVGQRCPSTTSRSTTGTGSGGGDCGSGRPSPSVRPPRGLEPHSPT